MSDIHIYLEREQPVKVITLEPTGARGPVGPQGPQGPAGPNSVTSATTSDATCELSLESLQVGQNSVVTGSAAAAIGECTASSSYDFAAGYQNTASGGASIALGSGSTASGATSFANGGSCVASADFGHASGFRAKAIHIGASVESDSQNADVESTTTDEKTFRFANGYRFLGGSATFEGTLFANHIHGNIAGNVYTHVRAGEALTKGDPVYISGSHGTAPNIVPIVMRADASNAAKMPAIGIVDADIANNANGHAVITGVISDINTNAYAVNTVLYVASGGGFTSTPPAANSQPVAIVERSNTNNGAVIVKVNGLASSGGNGASDANKLVRFSSTGTIPVASIGGLGTGVATALAVNTGSAGAFVVNGGIATDMTFAGTAAFTSTTRPTSAGTGTPAATSLITLTDADTRFGGPIYTSFLANNTSYTNDATGTTILSVTLPAGTYQIEAFARFTANASNSKTTPAITGGASELWTGFRETYNNGGSPSRIAGSNTPSVGGGPWGATSNSDNHGRYGTLKVSATATYSIIASQNTTSATTTTVSAGAYIIARKIV